MHPSRRIILKQLLAGVGSTIALPAISALAKPAVIGRQFYSSSEFDLVSRACDLIIPTTHTPGAVEACVPQYLDTLFAEWADAETQIQQHQFLAEFDLALSSNGAFTKLSKQAAAEQLSRFDTQAYANGDITMHGALHESSQTFKSRLTSAYALSEPGALLEMDWHAEPGQWIPSLPLNPAQPLNPAHK
jgi:gluconate 2-dehydrogenase gamma chain